ncbi:LOW QUALITY PROTEIN: cilia- and flagella-associated protein 337 [Phoenicopterus ruber ruber]
MTRRANGDRRADPPAMAGSSAPGLPFQVSPLPGITTVCIASHKPLCSSVLRIWGIQHQLRIQKIAGLFPDLKSHSSLYFNEAQRCPFISFNNELMLLEMEQETSRRVRGSEKAVSCVLCNSVSKEVISSNTGSTVIFLLTDSGQKIKLFTGCHGDAEFFEPCGICFHCHHKLSVGKDRAVDITQILVLRRMITVTCWDRVITAFHLNNVKQFPVQAEEGKAGSVSVSCPRCCILLPCILVTESRLFIASQMSRERATVTTRGWLCRCAGGPRRWLVAELYCLPDVTKSDRFESQGQILAQDWLIHLKLVLYSPGSCGGEVVWNSSMENPYLKLHFNPPKPLQSTSGVLRTLNIGVLKEIDGMNKSDFVLLPEKYFREKTEERCSENLSLPSLKEIHDHEQKARHCERVFSEGKIKRNKKQAKLEEK